ncbi:TLP18.3, Psb32 and MOLO-1 founding protein of phosphatase [bacterium A37T11]|nr:TLP18.3, Psb32 and MOLO-1 founding protein of phosphatase [bacterium A37T11]
MIFNSEEQAKLAYAINKAENKTSGEIRLCVEKHCPGEVLDRAVNYFHRLNMEKTALRNGVLIYLATEDHKFAIIGDKGIDQKVGERFWDETKNLMLEHFQNNRLLEGLEAGIDSAGQQLKTFFPRKDDDINELPDEVFFGDSQ